MSSCEGCKRRSEEIAKLTERLADLRRSLSKRREEEVQLRRTAVDAQKAAVEVAIAAVKIRASDFRRALFRVVRALDEGHPLEKPLAIARGLLQREAERIKAGR